MKRIYLFILFFISLLGFSQVNDLFTTQTADFSIASKNQYTVVETNKTSLFTNQIGAPQLPVFSRNYVLPAGSIVSNVSYSNGGKILLGSNYYLYPSQPPCALNGKPCPDFVAPDPIIYNSKTPFPAQTGTLVADFTNLGYRMVTLSICPFEYIPSDKKLYLFNQITVTINYSIGTLEYQARITESRHKITQDFIKAMVQNPSLINSSYKTANQIVALQTPTTSTDKLIIPWKPSSYGAIPDYIVITNNTLKSSFESFVQYKIQRGIPTLLVTVEDIYANYSGVDQAEKIRNYLKAAHQYWGAGLFVLLGGDTAVVPNRIGSRIYDPSIGLNELNSTDFYYCDVYKSGDLNYNWNSSGDNLFGNLNFSYGGFGNGNDTYDIGADNFIGRAPVDTQDEVNNFKAKIITYEKLEGVTETNYVNNMLFLGAYVLYNYVNPNYPNNPPVWDSGGQAWHRLLADKPFLSGPNLKKHLLFDDYIGSSHNTFLGNEELNRVTTLDRMSNGFQPNIGKFHLISHLDHGSPFGVGASGQMKGNSIFSEDMYNLSNGNYYQIMYTTACDPGKFELDCFSENYVNAPNGGGVAILANSGTVYTGGNEQDNKLFQSVYGNNSPSSKSYLIGLAFANARDASSLTGGYRQKQLTFFGEPTMATWSSTPQNITLSVQSNITINNAIANVLPVTINALTNDAVVTLYKFNSVTNAVEIYASQTLVAGTTGAQFTINPDTPGVMNVQVTAKNYLPATASVNILFQQAHLYISGYTFVDANGNGAIEQGENVALSINLTNSGSTNITLINTLLSCNPLFATIGNGAVNTTQINSGQTVVLTGFTFTAGNNNSLPNFIEFLLNITANGGFTHNDNLFLDLKNPVLTLGTRTMTVNGVVTTSFQLNQAHSLQIALSNIGNVPTGALTATLSTTMTNVVITTPNSTYLSINNTTGLNVAPFVFSFTGTSIPVGAKPFTLTLTNPYGKTWTFTFDLNEGLPLLITGFKFTSTTSEIKLIWNPITTMQGYNVYRSNTETDNYTKVNTFLVTGSSTYTDLAVSPATNYYYKISVVTLSGNERQLDQVVTNDTPAKQGYKTWTSLDSHGAFPINASASYSCYSSPTLFDVDTTPTSDHKKEIFLNHFTYSSEALGKTMGFKESGQEMFDIDGNPTTVSGFSSTNISMMSNAAVGDVDNDGHAEVFSIGRNNAINQGKLYAYKTVDANNDTRPDKLWVDEAVDLGWRADRNPVLYDVDGNGFLDIIVVDERQKVYVFDKDKNIMPGWPIQVPGGDYSLAEIAVADLDHDGKGEIALGCRVVNGTKGGIYIWHHDGTPFTVNPFKEFSDNEVASSVVFADIDNDLNLDVLLTTKLGSAGTICKIYAFKQNGQPINATWNGVNTFTAKNWDTSIPRLSVGDLNHDGNLEIALGSLTKLYLFDKNGVNVPNFPITTVDIWESAPIIADIDTDADSELIMNDLGKLIAYNIDGSSCIGFPIESNNGENFITAPSIDDIDNDGKNEIVISTLSSAKTFVYKTDGHSVNNEWSSYRANPYNTGTYKEVCNNVLDLMVRDGADDLGIQPNVTSQFFWDSNDIWIRNNNNDTSLEHQNPEYSANGAPVYIKVRVTNKSCMPSTGNEQLNVYWAKASSGLAWPYSWTGGQTFPATGAVMGNSVGTLTVPVVQPGQEVILTFPWQVANPYNYDGNDQWHFCLLSRLVAPNDPMQVIETNDDLVANVLNNNNIAWKNLTIVDAITGHDADPGGEIAVANPFNGPKTYTLELAVADAETGKPIYEEAEIGIKMDETLYNAWVRGGKGAQMLEATVEEKRKIVKGNHVLLDNISFNPREVGTLQLNFNFLTKELTNKSNFVYRVIQKDKQTGRTIGGETFIINKKPRATFVADAGDDKDVDLNQAITISAVDINEPAIYNWYDNDGNLIFQGKNLQIANAVAEKYKLEVISTVDGFKDYSEMEVKINPNRLKNIIPNPVVGLTKVAYNLNQASSAYLMIVSYYMSGGVSNNYVLDVNTSETNIDLSTYANGFYKVVLVVNGAIVDAKIVSKQ
jgi:Peptidase family C25/FG-GAP-like repeat/Propeptide_C25